MTPNDDRIEELLRAQRVAPVDDDGFTRQLMSQLPPRPRAVGRWVIPGMTLLGGLLAFGALARNEDLAVPFQQLMRGEPVTALVLLPVALIVAGCAWALSESK